MVFKGFMGEMELSQNAITITKHGKSHAIPLSQIISVVLEKPGLTSNGILFIQIVGGFVPSVGTSKLRYAKDLNALAFQKSQYQDAIAFKAAIERSLADK